MRVALVQMTSGDDPARNLKSAVSLVREAASKGAEFVLTPEVTNCVSSSRRHQEDVLRLEAEDQTLRALADEAKSLGIWLLIGSLALKTGESDGRFANRSLLINPEGEIKARYDKMHMFDVTLSETESYRESDGYRPGSNPTLTEVDGIPLGMTVCYDLRFPYLFRHLAHQGAKIITVPAAFAVPTGQAHWEVLLRARAIENGCFILAPAQTGQHLASTGKGRSTYGHSLVVAPWGEILLDAGEAAGVYIADLELDQVEQARRKVPALSHDREIE